MNQPNQTLFVRGKYQLARYEPGGAATGRRLTEREVREAYGPAVFPEIDEHLSAVLLRSTGAIERALRSRRDQLGVTRQQLASAAKVTVDLVKQAETNADRLSIHELERLAFVLGLDPAKLSVDESAGADADLGVRLRVLTQDQASPAARLSPRTVLRFSEAASIILAQIRLQSWLGEPGAAGGFQASYDYGPRAWQEGYDLAEHSRQCLGLGHEPIRSMRELVESRLGIPIIQVELPASIAGATIVSSGCRGIVLNTTGANTNVWIRRTTLAHELAHILFDPEERLSKVRVDSYEQLGRDTEDNAQAQDDVEQRANAFAVEFLAPREAVRGLTDVAQVSGEDIGRVMSKFGIGRAAARFHVGNAWYRQVELPPESTIRSVPTDKQRAAEEFTQDYFPIQRTPGQRRGRFALLVAEAVDGGLITADTATQYLTCYENELSDALPYLLEMA